MAPSRHTIKSAGSGTTTHPAVLRVLKDSRKKSKKRKEKECSHRTQTPSTRPRIKRTKHYETAQDTQELDEQELPPTPSRPAFERVPVELWKQITTEFELADIVSLSLSCRHALAMFGSRSMVELRNPLHHVQRLRLLFAMSACFPTHYLCNHCVIYHSNEKNYQNYSPLALQIQEEPWHLSYTRVSEAMASYRSRPSIPVKTSFARHFKTLRPDWRGWRTTVMDAGVDDGRLMLLVTYRRPVTAALQQEYRENTENSSPLSMPTCQHLENPAPLACQVQTAITNTPLPWQPKKSYKFKSPAFRCPYCPSEYRVMIRKYEDEEVIAREGCRFEMVFYRCIDAGRGMSPHCPQWRALTSKRLAGTDAASPFDVEGRRMISWRCGYTLAQRQLVARSVLPLTDH